MPAGFALSGTAGCRVEAPGCETVLGPVGLCEQAPNSEAADTSMNNRIVRGMARSGLRETYPYRLTARPMDIAGDSIICRGAAR